MSGLKAKAEHLPTLIARRQTAAQRRLAGQRQTARVLSDHVFALTDVVTRGYSCFPDLNPKRQSQPFRMKQRFQQLGRNIIPQTRNLLEDLVALRVKLLSL
jgi:hypothetical protein